MRRITVRFEWWPKEAEALFYVDPRRFLFEISLKIQYL